MRICKACVCDKDKAKRHRARLAGTFWFEEASGNKKPLSFDFDVRAGSFWLKYRDTYELVLRLNESVLRSQCNPKAARVLAQHRQGLPKTLPYVIHVTGTEWPLIASALLRCRDHAATDEFRKAVQNLYGLLGRAKREQQP